MGAGLVEGAGRDGLGIGVGRVGTGREGFGVGAGLVVLVGGRLFDGGNRLLLPGCVPGLEISPGKRLLLPGPTVLPGRVLLPGLVLFPGAGLVLPTGRVDATGLLFTSLVVTPFDPL